MNLTKSQSKALQMLKSGNHIFLTGGAGTGKTTVIKQFIKEVDPYCEYTVLCAPTGKAALNMMIETPDGFINGNTIHRTFGLKANNNYPSYPEHNIPKCLEIANRLIIDEVSMLRIDLFDYIIKVIQAASERRWDQLQVIMIGDFFQLPPVLPDVAPKGISDKEKLNRQYGYDIGKGYCFLSKQWADMKFTFCNLSEVMRQKDDSAFAIALNKIRIGNPEGITYINQNCARGFSDKRITICGTNKKAEEINALALSKLTSKKYCFECTVYSDLSLSSNEIKKYLENANCDTRLNICEDARIICIANNECAVNGQMGTVVEIASEGITVQWDNGDLNVVKKYTWEITRQDIVQDGYGKESIEAKIIMTIEQYPLKLAYAITVHKSQGSTMDAVNVSADLFETGHLYTALSRCTNVKNLGLKRPLTIQDVKCDKIINDFYEGSINEKAQF